MSYYHTPAHSMLQCTETIPMLLWKFWILNPMITEEGDQRELWGLCDVCHVHKQGDACVSTPNQLKMYQGRQPGRPFLKKNMTGRVSVAVCEQRRSLQYGPESTQGLEAWDSLYPVQLSCLNFIHLFQLWASVYHFLNQLCKVQTTV